jgi:hypothetical protein
VKDMMVNTSNDDDDDDDYANNYVFFSKPFFSHLRSEWENETDVG